LVFAFTTEAIDVEAEVMVPAVEAVLLVIAVPRDVDTVRTVALVLALTADVSAVIAEARDDEAFVTSDVFARVPDVRVASVRLRVANDQTCEAVMPVARESCLPVVPSAMTLEVAMFQTSEARVPNVVRDRTEFAHTAVGMVEASDEEAVNTVALVFELMVEIAEAT
jgi:hypothetical protein